ncbi:hypothetical protein ACHAXH_002847 [Discostella pseudostelligera]
MGDTTTNNNAAEQGEIPCSNDSQFWLDLGRVVDDDDTYNPCFNVTIPEIVIVDSASTTTAPPSTEDRSSSTYKTFYSCFSDDSTIEMNTNGVTSTLTADATKVFLTYDYDLITSKPLDDKILTSLSNDMAYDLADRYGLVDCNIEPSTKRRSLRSLKVGDVIALDNSPLDQNLADQYECEVPDTLLSTTTTTIDTTIVCTPVRGFMKAWLSKSTTNKVQIKSELLTMIENGMLFDSYTNEDVLKTVYVGRRPENTGSDNLGAVNSANVEAIGSQQSEPTKRSPLIAIGMSLFFVAIALAVALVAYNRRKRRRKYFSDGPDDMSNPKNSALAVQAALADRHEHAPKDPDDIQLLPSMDKIDMRSVYSDGTSSADAHTENYTDGTVGKYSFMYDGLYHADGRGSDLAAMGMASSLATQTFNNEAPRVD